LHFSNTALYLRHTQARIGEFNTFVSGSDAFAFAWLLNMKLALIRTYFYTFRTGVFKYSYSSGSACFRYSQVISKNFFSSRTNKSGAVKKSCSDLCLKSELFKSFARAVNNVLGQQIRELAHSLPAKMYSACGRRSVIQ